VLKGPDAFRTISEVADDLDLPQHVLRFWETRFGQIKPLKRGGGRRYYRPDDVELLRGIRQLLYGEGYTIRGVQRILREEGPKRVVEAGRRMPAVPIPRPVAPEEIGGDPDALFLEDDQADIEAMEPEEAPVPRVRAGPSESTGAVSGDVAGRLKATLAQLLECKRLLDQAR